MSYPQDNEEAHLRSSKEGKWQSEYPPAAHGNPPPNSGEWHASLFGCGGDIVTCCLGTWCSCVLVGRSIEFISQGKTPCSNGGANFAAIEYLTGKQCGWVYTLPYRRRFRQKYGLPSGPIPDILIEMFFPECSACQMEQEFKSRGIDPALGYERVKHIYDQPANGKAPSQQEMMH